MNVNQVVSIAVKFLLAVSGFLVSVNMLSAEQLAQVNEWLGGIQGAVATIVSAAIGIYSLVRSLKTHKEG